jgi:hypothetical protein
VWIGNLALLIGTVIGIGHDLRAPDASRSAFLAKPPAGWANLAGRQAADNRIESRNDPLRQAAVAAGEMLASIAMHGEAMRNTWAGSAGPAKARTSSVTGCGRLRYPMRRFSTDPVTTPMTTPSALGCALGQRIVVMSLIFVMTVPLGLPGNNEHRRRSGS